MPKFPVWLLFVLPKFLETLSRDDLKFEWRLANVLMFLLYAEACPNLLFL